MSTIKSREEMLEEIIEKATLEEKIKLYLDAHVGHRQGISLLDTAKSILFYYHGMNKILRKASPEMKLLSLEQKIEIMAFVLANCLDEKIINDELRNLPEHEVDEQKLLNEYGQQVESMKQAQLADKH